MGSSISNGVRSLAKKLTGLICEASELATGVESCGAVLTSLGLEVVWLVGRPTDPPPQLLQGQLRRIEGYTGASLITGPLNFMFDEDEPDFVFEGDPTYAELEARLHI